MMANILGGLSLRFSKPFSIGDSIKVTLSLSLSLQLSNSSLVALLLLELLTRYILQAGSIEGEITEIGLTTTSLINPEEFPVKVPNSVFSSQVK